MREFQGLKSKGGVRLSSTDSQQGIRTQGSIRGLGHSKKFMKINKKVGGVTRKSEKGSLRSKKIEKIEKFAKQRSLAESLTPRCDTPRLGVTKQLQFQLPAPFLTAAKNLAATSTKV
ncbi:hypothetical protein PIB30_073186 [Stylosanthes scabra]|uniref:Uncharacterized protein n=1 Tax=Stylosanthes scabra TaxID=79078 RepID=A0ABU6VMR5_9FABA|nr:hypothetical protein [Stylosanthes scabra]